MRDPVTRATYTDEFPADRKVVASFDTNIRETFYPYHDPPLALVFRLLCLEPNRT